MPMDSSYSGEPKLPVDEYDSAHGKQDDSIPHVSEDQAWGTSQNPVRETPNAATNLKQV